MASSPALDLIRSVRQGMALPSSANPSTDFRKLHLGCGPRHLPGFFHVDAIDHPHIDHVGPVQYLDFIADGQVELIYACHVLEHFGRLEVFDVVSEWYRVLRPGGRLRVAVPDFAAAARVYQQHGDLRDILGLLVGGQTTLYDHHKMVFDEISLGELLIDVGFRQIDRYDWRTTEHAHLDDYSQAYLPHMDKATGTLMSLNVEAVK